MKATNEYSGESTTPANVSQRVWTQPCKSVELQIKKKQWSEQNLMTLKKKKNLSIIKNCTIVSPALWSLTWGVVKVASVILVTELKSAFGGGENAADSLKKSSMLSYPSKSS